LILILLSVGGVQEVGLLKELLLNQSRRHEASEHVRAASSVVGTRASSTTEGLLTDESSSGLAV
jgi:hypothetical protein